MPLFVILKMVALFSDFVKGLTLSSGGMLFYMQDIGFCQFETLIIISLTNNIRVVNYDQMTKKKEMPMSRPKRPRCIGVPPVVTEFGPKEGREKGEVVLSFEEFEAVRLIDYDGLDQGQAAGIMNVSRQTVGRILRAGRFKLTKAVVASCRLKLSGGCYEIDETISGRGRHRRRRGGGGRGHGHRRNNP